jgi:hypothetical protein
MLNYSTLLREKLPTESRTQLLRHIIICRKSTNQRIIDDNKIILFRRLHKVIIKNINTYFYMVKDKENETTYSKDDMVIESYIIYQKCLNKFQFNKYKDFIWFLNTALGRAMVRLAERENKKNNSIINAHDDEWLFTYNNDSTHSEADFTDFYIKQFNLSKLERIVLRSKVNMEKVDYFLEKHNSVTRNVYYKTLQNIKDKFKELNDDDNS